MFANEHKPDAPELSVSQWFNSETPLTLEKLQGRPVLINTFQMLCPGCVANSIPQMKKVHQLFGQSDLAILGLHTVFEHHDIMTPNALKAFIHEYQLKYPIGVDKPASQGVTPETMTNYQLRGTPSTILLNRNHEIILNAFGHVEDLVLGSAVQSVLEEKPVSLESPERADALTNTDQCDDNGCTVAS